MSWCTVRLNTAKLKERIEDWAMEKLTQTDLHLMTYCSSTPACVEVFTLCVRVDIGSVMKGWCLLPQGCTGWEIYDWLFNQLPKWSTLPVSLDSSCALLSPFSCPLLQLQSEFLWETPPPLYFIFSFYVHLALLESIIIEADDNTLVMSVVTTNYIWFPN